MASAKFEEAKQSNDVRSNTNLKPIMTFKTTSLKNKNRCSTLQVGKSQQIRESSEVNKSELQRNPFIWEPNLFDLKQEDIDTEKFELVGPYLQLYIKSHNRFAMMHDERIRSLKELIEQMALWSDALHPEDKDVFIVIGPTCTGKSTLNCAMAG